MSVDKGLLFETEKVENNDASDEQHDKRNSNDWIKNRKCVGVVILVAFVLMMVGAGVVVYFVNKKHSPSSASSSSNINSNKYYAVVNKALNYSDANDYCVSQYGTSLATIFDMYDNNIVHKLCNWTVSGSESDGCWIGYTKLGRYKSSKFLVENINSSDWFWIWHNKSLDSNFTNDFENWNGNDEKMKENAQCAFLLNANGSWNSDTCVNKYRPFVCNYYDYLTTDHHLSSATNGSTTQENIQDNENTISYGCSSFSSPPNTDDFLSGFNMFSNSVVEQTIFNTSIFATSEQVTASFNNGGCSYYLPASISDWTDTGFSLCSSSLMFSSSYTSYSSYSKSDGLSLSAAYNSGDSSLSIGHNSSNSTQLSGLGSLLSSSSEEAFVGSTSAVRSTMKSGSYSSKTYFYSMDISCKVAAFTLKADKYLEFDGSFVYTLISLPTSFDSTSDISIYKTFWAEYGTHYMFYSEMGGNIYGAASANSCDLTKNKISESQFGVDLNSCFESSDDSTSSAGTTVNLYMSNSKFTIRGGSSSDTFETILSSFSTTSSNIPSSYAAWVNGLFDEPAPTQGVYVCIHTLLQNLGKYYDGGNLLEMMNNIDDSNNYWTSGEIYEIGKAMEDAYNYYSDELNNDQIKCQYTKSSYSCTSGEGVYFDNTTCSCTCSTSAACLAKLPSKLKLLSLLLLYFCLFF